jgi:hypothetical protein
MSEVLMEVSADVLEKNDRTNARFRCRLPPDAIPNATLFTNRVDFWIAWDELADCSEEKQLHTIRNGIRKELCSYGAKLSEHEMPDWALRLLLRHVRADVELQADAQKTTGQKRKLYEESRKTKNISTWKMLFNCKGYISKSLNHVAYVRLVKNVVLE